MNYVRFSVLRPAHSELSRALGAVDGWVAYCRSVYSVYVVNSSKIHRNIKTSLYLTQLQLHIHLIITTFEIQKSIFNITALWNLLWLHPIQSNWYNFFLPDILMIYIISNRDCCAEIVAIGSIDRYVLWSVFFVQRRNPKDHPAEI